MVVVTMLGSRPSYYEVWPRYQDPPVNKRTLLHFRPHFEGNHLNVAPSIPSRLFVWIETSTIGRNNSSRPNARSHRSSHVDSDEARDARASHPPETRR